jgi:ABC-2 type transport system permease protein
LFLAFTLLQLEITAVTVAVSAFLRKGGIGIGLGITFLLYALNLLSNLAEDAEFLRYFTPFGFASGAEILDSGSLPAIPLAVGAVVTALSVAAAYFGYTRKDIS